jgi:hypothetical protein
MQGHDAYPERPRNVALQRPLLRKVIRLSKLGSDFGFSRLLKKVFGGSR